jgi:competence ComEA-like helix-hairpin-helix protein
MNNIKSYFLFSKEHRSGIFLLICIIIITQLLYFFIDFTSFKGASQQTNAKNWLLVQSEIDSLNNISKEKKFKITPFNPNFISDYKGYLLGMSVTEIDRLHKFRESNKFVNSAKEFQQVTQVSDSLLKILSPNFKFPDWVTNKKSYQSNTPHKFYNKSDKHIVQKDINSASKEELMEVYGIGDKISDIILQEKEKFGAFATIDQLEYVWGISPEALNDVKKRFYVKSDVLIKKVNINNLSTKELAKFPYFKYALAKEIVTYRSMNGDFKSIDDLTKIKGMPNEKIKIIALYLEF